MQNKDSLPYTESGIFLKSVTDITESERFNNFKFWNLARTTLQCISEGASETSVFLFFWIKVIISW